jgi:hypothetical protein
VIESVTFSRRISFHFSCRTGASLIPGTPMSGV